MCTREIIDFYDCAYPAGTEQDMTMKEEMWKANLAQAERMESENSGKNQSEDDFMDQIAGLPGTDDAMIEAPGSDDGEADESENTTLALPQSQNNCVDIKQDLQDCIDAAKSK